MIPLTLKEIASLTGGRLHGVDDVGADDILVDGPVVTDSREAGPGSLYVARVGESMDGHLFVPAAKEVGAVAALTTREVDGLPCVVVDDIQDGFAALAQGVLQRRPDITVVGVTGSSGKTSTKDLLASVLSTAGPTVGAGRVAQQRGRRAADHLPHHPGHALPHRGDGSPRYRTHRLPGRYRGRRPSASSSTSARPTSASSGPGRRSAAPRPSSSRPCRTAGWPSSTPTTPRSGRW